MRRNIVHPGAEELTYEIRGIVTPAKEFEKLGMEITWENIGDPIQKGEKIPLWMKNIAKHELDDDFAWGYCPTKGIIETREYLAEKVNKRGKTQISPEDITFFNGLGDAVSTAYHYLNPNARIIGPSPAYTTHSSSEGAHATDDPLTYKLNPRDGWLPDLDELENKVKYNEKITGILTINPDNPTGMVYPQDYLEKIVKIAKKYDLFIITDEIYINLSYNGTKAVPLSDVIDDVPGISMKGISKEFPWPGARCGWIEVYNKRKDKNKNFSRYVESIDLAKSLEVCSTTHPQKTIPKIMSHKDYIPHLNARNRLFEERAIMGYEKLKDIEGIIVNKTKGAFYESIIFDRKYLNNRQHLKISNPHIKEKVEELSKGRTFDWRFVYNLMGATGICVVPMTSFCSDLPGFRITLLETNRKKFEWTFDAIAEKIKEYLNSA